jgi:hypothetical protein
MGPHSFTQQFLFHSPFVGPVWPNVGLSRSGRCTKLSLLLHTFGKPGACHQRRSRCRLEPVLGRFMLEEPIAGISPNPFVSKVLTLTEYLATDWTSFFYPMISFSFAFC